MDMRENYDQHETGNLLAELRDLLAAFSAGELTTEQYVRIQYLSIDSEAAWRLYLQHMFMYGTLCRKQCNRSKHSMPTERPLDYLGDGEASSKEMEVDPPSSDHSIFPLLDMEKDLLWPSNDDCNSDLFGDNANCTDKSSHNGLENSSPFFLMFTFLSRPIPLAIIMICVLVLPMVMMAWNLTNSQPPTCVVPGQVVKAVGCTWDDEQGVNLRVGDLLVGNQEYHLKEGILQLDFASGVQTIIQGPAVFRPKSSMLLELTEGRLSAKVPPEGKNFTVTMAGLKVIDRGTEFGVSAGRDAEVELHVFKGRIDVMTDSWEQDGKVKQFELREGQASRVHRLTGKVKRMAADQSKFIRKFSTESGLNLNLINPSFEEPRVTGHPKMLKKYGNLRSAYGLLGWTTLKSSDAIGKYPIYLQQTPYLADPTGKFKIVQRCTQKAIDGQQMLTMRLGWAKKAWVFQSIGTIRMGDIGKTLQVSTTVVARESIHEDVTDYGSTATAVLAFTVNTTGKSQGKVIGFSGVASGVSLDQPSQHLMAELTIKPHMIGKNLAVRLLVQDPDPQREKKFKDEYDPINQYFFDVVNLKLRYQENIKNSSEKTEPLH